MLITYIVLFVRIQGWNFCLRIQGWNFCLLFQHFFYLSLALETRILQVYHPNIDLEGNVCLNILREDWKPVLNINTIIYGLYHLCCRILLLQKVVCTWINHHCHNSDKLIKVCEFTMLNLLSVAFEQCLKPTYYFT